METSYNTDLKSKQLVEKQTTITEVKCRFNKMIRRRLGALLIRGLSEYLGEEILDPNQIKFFKLPLFLKPIFTYFHNDQLLLEVSILYIIYSLGLMNNEMQTNYDIYLAKIEYKKYEIKELRDLLWINLEREQVFTCKFQVPPYLLRILPIIEEKGANLVAFGILKIFEWLDLLPAKVQLLVSIYERSFQELYQTIHESDKNK
ncbi:MAG: hypothetical protein ACTSRS_10730 [Candidatus Helarchaeota archaeon]